MARKILLADDSVTAQNMGRKILSDAGYEVTTVNNGSAALKKIAEQRPDLIVLDVYMPGYSGLEVCQRIKEMRETARIPILLTVGKLEPFKPEEARKARADAYIVKPFEASELLVALTKLEDKIVPQPEAYKPGRFAKAIAAVERFNPSEPAESFGDKDSGWKNRIKFPSHGAKAAEPEPQEIQSKSSLRGEEDKPVEPSREFQRPIPEGLPKDITPEEIEAITAAAAQFSGRPATAASEEAVRSGDPQTAVQPDSGISESASAAFPIQRETSEVAVESTAGSRSAEGSEQIADAELEQAQREDAPVTFAGAAQSCEAEQTPGLTTAASQQAVDEQGREQPEESGSEQVSAAISATPEIGENQRPFIPQSPPEAPRDSELRNNEEDSSAAQLTGAPQTEQQGAPSVPQTAEESSPGTDAEVAAALHSLSPTQGNAAGDVSPPTTVEAGSSGPRWVAEPVALEGEEASIALESEMQKVFAASVPTQTPETSLDSVTAAAQVSTASNDISSHFRSTEPASATSEEAFATSEQTSAPEAASTYATESAAEEHRAKDPEPSATTSGLANTVASSESSELPEIQQTEAMSEPEGLAPAEANAQSDAASQPSFTPVAEALPGSSKEKQDANDSDETSAKAAAWEDWEHLRDSIVGSTARFASTATAAANSAEAEAPSKPEAMAAAAGADGIGSSAPEGDASALANIVDSVLAELKPKLMEELARKMKKESK